MKNNYSIIPQVLKANPRMAFELAQAFTAMNKAKIMDYNLGEGKSDELPLITFKITPVCNLQCVMCGQNGVNGTMKKKDIETEIKSMVDIDRYKKLTDEVAGKTKIFYVWGGEPLLYPNFMDLASYMAKKVVLTVNTNGTLLAKNAKRIVEDQWGGIFISLDGFEKTNDAVRGKGTYARVMEGIAAINEQKKSQKSHLPYMGIVTAISSLNYSTLDMLAAAMKDKGLAWHIINLGTYTTPEIGARHREHLKDKLGIDPVYWEGFANGYNKGIDGKKFAKILERVHSYNNGYPIITVPVIDPHRIGTYYSDLEFPVRDECGAPWFSVDINYNGDVHFCADYPDYILGNIKNSGMMEIYNNEKAVKFRKALQDSEHGLFPACKRCYQLMLFGHQCDFFHAAAK